MSVALAHGGVPLYAQQTSVTCNQVIESVHRYTGILYQTNQSNLCIVYAGILAGLSGETLGVGAFSCTAHDRSRECVKYLLEAQADPNGVKTVWCDTTGLGMYCYNPN